MHMQACMSLIYPQDNNIYLIRRLSQFVNSTAYGIILSNKY